ncbi:MAG: hypothetical protein RSB67_01360 [Clostridia bacterium]
MRKIEKQTLENLGYKIVEIKAREKLYFEIASHVDIFCTKIKNKLIIDPIEYENIINSTNSRNILKGVKSVGFSYPEDIAYNVCNIGENVVHNFKYTDERILEIIQENNMNKININQGYSKCSIAVVEANSCIVCDKKIAEALQKSCIDVLCISEKMDIKLLDKSGSYSNMNGFIGGAISKIGNNIFISGDLKKIDKNDKIREYIEKKGLHIIDFKGLDVIDYGGMLELEG